MHFMFKSNEIEIADDEDNPQVAIAGTDIEVEGLSENEVFRTPLAFGEFRTLEDLARGVVDAQLSLEEDAELGLASETAPPVAVLRGDN